MTERDKLAKSLMKLLKFLTYVFKKYKIAPIIFILPVPLLILEYAAFSLMLPISGGRAESANSNFVIKFWDAVALTLGLPADQMTWIWLFLLLLALRMLLGFAHTIGGVWLSKLVHQHLSGMAFRHVLVNEPISEIYKRSIGYYMSLAGDDTFRAGTIVLTTSQIFVGILSVLAGFILLYLFSINVFLFIVVVLLVSIYFIYKSFSGISNSNGEAIHISREAGTLYIECLNSLRSIRSIKAENFVIRKYGQLMSVYVRLLFFNEAVKNGIKFIPAIVALFIGIYFIRPNSPSLAWVTPVYIFSIITLLIRVFVSLGAVINSINILLAELRSVKDIQGLISLDSKNIKPWLAATQDGIKVVEMECISYSYDSMTPVLANFNCILLTGKTYAVIGPSGAGKSTLADILMGLLVPTGGIIKVDGVETTNKMFSLNVVLVEQQVRIFSGSILENILMDLNSSQKEVEDVLKVVELNQLIDSMPGNLSYKLNYQGSNISGGQRQRIGLARGLLRRPDILIIDEGTSALDPITKIRVIENIKNYAKKAIIIFITHDSELEDLADHVISMHPLKIATRVPGVLN
jgi:ATP-binding cassette subfamily B protein